MDGEICRTRGEGLPVIVFFGFRNSETGSKRLSITICSFAFKTIKKSRRMTHGFEKLSARLDEIYAVEGYDELGMFSSLCDAVLSVAPPAALKRGPKTKEAVERRYKSALAAIERIRTKGVRVLRSSREKFGSASFSRYFDVANIVSYEF